MLSPASQCGKAGIMLQYMRDTFMQALYTNSVYAIVHAMMSIMQGSVYKPITQNQADSAHIHERLAAHRTPMMLTAANVSLAAPVGTTPLVCSKTTWGLGNTALSK